MSLHPIGFYRIRLEGEPGVAYCNHEGPYLNDTEPHETWTTLHLFSRFDRKPHPASATITPRSGGHYARHLEILSKIKL